MLGVYIMPLYHCSCCHHEFERIPDNPLTQLCDWCGAPSYILEEKTPLENMCEDIERAGGFENWIKQDKRNRR